MSGHPDILDVRESLRGPFWGSLVFHLSLAMAAAAYAWIGPAKAAPWGAPDGGGLGSIAVNPVATIPLPRRDGPVNPVASDTESLVPTPPPKTKAQPKAKAPEPDAIALKSRNSKKREAQLATAPPNKWSVANPPRENQVTSTAGQRMNSPMFDMPGGGGVGIGSASPLGTQFGEYATRLRDQVARNWKTSDLDARVQSAPVAVVFTIRRDGSLVPGSVKISESSGNRSVDISAQRAVHDAAPFPPLPTQYSGSDAALELKFHLRR